MNKHFKPKSGQPYWVIEAKFKTSPIWWTGNTPKSKNALKRNEMDIWEWTTDIFKAKCFETQSEAMEANFDFQVNGTITEHINYSGKQSI